MKTYMKKELEFKSGLLFHGSELVSVDPVIVDAVNKLESDAQLGYFNSKKAEAMEEFEDVMSLEFHRQSARPEIEFEVKTEHLDKAIDEAIAIMDDVDAERKGDKVREYLDMMAVVVQFVDDDFVIDTECAPCRFDTPLIGNPLELEAEDLVKLAELAVS